MSKSNKYKVYNGKNLKEFYKNSRIYILVLMFAAGIIIGAVSVNSETFLSEKITKIADVFSAQREGQGITEIFINSFSVNGLFSVLGVFLGFSLIGYPILIWLPFLKGLGLGAFCGYLYSAFALSGIGYSVAIIYPGAIVSAFALVLSCNDACDYSKNAFLKSICGKGQFEKDETKIFVIRQLIFITVTAASSFIDALVSIGFSRFFEI